MTDESQTTQEDAAILNEMMKSYGVATPDEKYNVFKFLNDIAISKDTTKTGNLTPEEIGTTLYSLRTYKKLMVDSTELCDDDIWAGYFKEQGEILPSTSLSKDGFLANLAVLQRREIADKTKKVNTMNKGWFKKKDSNNEEGGGQ